MATSPERCDTAAMEPTPMRRFAVLVAAVALLAASAAAATDRAREGDKQREAPKPPRVVGVWELKADDSRTGTLTLRPRGTLTASSSTGDLSLPDYNGNWYLLDEDGDKFVLEFARERGGLDGYKVTLVLTSPEAFTLVETVKSGQTIRDAQRFVRVTEPAEK